MKYDIPIIIPGFNTIKVLGLMQQQISLEKNDLNHCFITCEIIHVMSIILNQLTIFKLQVKLIYYNRIIKLSNYQFMLTTIWIKLKYLLEENSIFIFFIYNTSVQLGNTTIMILRTVILPKYFGTVRYVW